MRVISQTKIDHLFACFRASMGIRASARMVGCSKNTTRNYLRLFESTHRIDVLCACGKPRHRGWCKAQEQLTRTEAMCGCGKPLRHRGWCRIRFARSPQRQAIVRRWHPKPQRAIVVLAANPTFTEAERQDIERRRLRVMMAGKTKRASIDDLLAAVAKSDAPIRRLPSGAHIGWRPSWMHGDAAVSGEA